jgi:hypothetical protein
MAAAHGYCLAFRLAFSVSRAGKSADSVFIGVMLSLHAPPFNGGKSSAQKQRRNKPIIFSVNFMSFFSF